MLEQGAWLSGLHVARGQKHFGVTVGEAKGGRESCNPPGEAGAGIPPYGVCLEVVWAEGSPKRGAGWVQGEHRTATRDLLLQEERQRPRGAAGWFSPALQLSRCSGWSGSSSTFPSTDSRAARAVPVTCSTRGEGQGTGRAFEREPASWASRV